MAVIKQGVAARAACEANYTVGEEIANAVTHGVAALLSIAALVQLGFILPAAATLCYGFLTIRMVGLYDNYWVYILPMAFNMFNAMVFLS